MVRGTGAVFVACLATGCAKPLDVGVVLTPSTLSTADPTVCERLLERGREPRPFPGEPWAASKPGESSSSRESSVLLGARPGAALPHACLARLERDAEAMLADASERQTGRVPRSAPSHVRGAKAASLCSEAPRLARLPLEAFRRDHLALGPDCSF